jgi:PAS domain S-box-containing protein
MVDGLIIIDGSGTIRYANPGCARLFRYDHASLLGRNVSSLMPAPFSESHDGHLARHRETKVRRIIGVGRELTGLRSDGTVFPLYLSVSETRIEEETLFVGVIYDLTEKKRAEELILHHQKLDAIGQLSGGIAHDFNNILSVIDGNLEMLAAHDLPAPAKRALARAHDAATKAARITHRLLAFARRQPLSRQPINLNSALENIAEMLHRYLGETIEVNMFLDPSIGMVDADIDQFETAILNLSLNSRDAMPFGGRLTIETDRVTFEDDPRAIQEVPSGSYVRVSVSDNGLGMTRDVLERALEPFFTTKDVGEGTGLGLSMVYGFLKQLGGHARIYSELGRGTRVSLFFPCSTSETDHTPATVDGEIPQGRGEMILVVEDDPDVRHVTVTRLESLGYKVRTAKDAAAALAEIRALRNIDLALLDMVMPGGMDGHALAARIQEIAPEIRLILTSGYSVRMASADNSPPALPFLSKPVSRLTLARTIRSVLDSEV